ncbi:hypothetical protein [Leisingera aquimarina]|uniref:hypothetical protein n=1 Tax=Leisingera aquimarina TaxID=476529 RepID=UPI0012EC7C8C|nr:hypothetical protein [Leisingera aquimarina]
MGRHIHGNRQSQASDSALNKYLKRVVGSSRKADLLKYELITMLLTNFPGAAGLILRQKIYPSLSVITAEAPRFRAASPCAARAACLWGPAA